MIKVFALDDVEFWAGESLADCLAEARRQCGDDCYADEEEHHELDAADLERMKFFDEDNPDGKPITMAAHLANEIAKGTAFPCLLAATEY